MNFLKRIYNRWYQLRVRLHKRNYILGALTHVTSIVIVAFLLVFIFTFYILQPYRVSGQSMEPTLRNGDRLFVWRAGKIMADFFGADYVPERGEIIVFQSQLRDDKWIKRVIGLPNERIVIKNNVITIYNEKFPEGFNLDLGLEPILPDFSPNEVVVDRIIGKGEVFVIGDNRLSQQSSDSRGPLGNISIQNIDGVVFLRMIPMKEVRLF